jgi:hypothetical protein
MIKVFQTITEVEANVVKAVFLENGISATIKNQNITNIAGEVPFTECYSEIWISDKIDYDEIVKILDQYKSAKESKEKESDWVCLVCDEANDSSFEICWQCQTPTGLK